MDGEKTEWCEARISYTLLTAFLARVFWCTCTVPFCLEIRDGSLWNSWIRRRGLGFVFLEFVMLSKAQDAHGKKTAP